MAAGTSISIDTRAGPIVLDVPAGTQPVTAASVVAIRGVAAHLDLLHGIGIDWGTGTGGLAIAAAMGAAVATVIAIDVDGRVERDGGHAYEFQLGRPDASGPVSADRALARHAASGSSPLTRWQLHLYRRT